MAFGTTAKCLCTLGDLFELGDASVLVFLDLGQLFAKWYYPQLNTLF